MRQCKKIKLVINILFVHERARLWHSYYLLLQESFRKAARVNLYESVQTPTVTVVTISKVPRCSNSFIALMELSKLCI